MHEIRIFRRKVKIKQLQIVIDRRRRRRRRSIVSPLRVKEDTPHTIGL